MVLPKSRAEGEVTVPRKVEYIESYIKYDDGYQFLGATRLIRCNDCMHHHGYSCDRLYGLQDAFTLQDDDYCSRAERKEGN